MSKTTDLQCPRTLCQNEGFHLHRFYWVFNASMLNLINCRTLSFLQIAQVLRATDIQAIRNYSWTVKKMQISNYNVAWTNRTLYLSNRCGYYIIAMVVFYCLLPNIRARHNIKKRSLYIAESIQNGILQKIRIIMFVFMFQYIFYCFYIYFLQDDDVFICLDFRSTTCFTVYVIFLRVHLCHLFIHGNNVLDLTKF